MIFSVSSSYWQEHYQFDKESPKKKKNAIEVIYRFDYDKYLIPIQFAYAKSRELTLQKI
jgi:hypothetical protein